MLKYCDGQTLGYYIRCDYRLKEKALAEWRRRWNIDYPYTVKADGTIINMEEIEKGER